MSSISAPLVFVDVETTGLRAEDQPWEIAMFRRDPVTGDLSGLSLYVEHDRDLAEDLPLRFWIGYQKRFGLAESNGAVVSRLHAALAVVDFVQGSDEFGTAHLVGMNPRFDEAHLGRLLREFGLAVPWHFHLIDVEALALGALAGRGVPVEVPFRSDELAARLGVGAGVPVWASASVRHTAVGDAVLAMDVFDAVVASGRVGGVS